LLLLRIGFGLLSAVNAMSKESATDESEAHFDEIK
jgi:hypothetical protein